MDCIKDELPQLPRQTWDIGSSFSVARQSYIIDWMIRSLSPNMLSYGVK